MEHKQFLPDDLHFSPHSSQGFQADRFIKKTNQLNIPDTILEICSAESSGDGLKMEAPEVVTESFNNYDKENSFNQQVIRNESLNNSAYIPLDNSYILQCERKLLESSNSDDEKNTVNNNSLLLKVSRKFNETVSTPPSLLRREINLLRSEIAEADEFHDLEIRLLKEEKFLNEVDAESNVELLDKYTTLMELYTALKNSYDEYRKAQEKVGRELQSKTADCLETLCSQIETSDSSLNFSATSFVSFNGEIRSSTMMEDASEVEATVVHDATVLANDPLSITGDGAFKTPKQTPLKSARKLFPQQLNSTGRKTPEKEVDGIAGLNATTPLDSEYNIQLLNLETALYDKVKEVKDLEQRLFKMEDLSVMLQNEFERISSAYAEENNALKEGLLVKTEELNELTQKLLTETISLDPSLRDSLIDVSGKKLLLVFIETIMENCKKIKGEDALKADENLQSQLAAKEAEVDALRKSCEILEGKLSDSESTVLTRDEEIRMLQSHVASVRQTREELTSTKEKLELRLKLEEAEKKAIENRCLELETTIKNCNERIEENGRLRTELEVRLWAAEAVEKENSRLKELHDALELKMSETETVLKSEMLTIKENLSSAEEIIEKLKSQLETIEEEKSHLQNELRNTNQKLETAGDNTAYEEIQTENDDLKRRISDAEKIVGELKTELELSKECQERKVEELMKEMERLNNDKSGLCKLLDDFEESQRNLADALADEGDSHCEKIRKLMERTQSYSAETRDGKLMSVFVETIVKTCHGIQNELIKKFDGEKLEWETQRDADLNLMDNLREEMKLIVERREQQEAQISLEKEELMKSHENLKSQMADTEKIISKCNDEIKSYEAVLKRTEEELAAAGEKIMQLKLQLSSTETRKAEMERELEESRTNLQAEINAKETILRETNEFKTFHAKVENENVDLRQRIGELEEAIVHLKEAADEGKSRIKDSENEIDQLKKDKEGLIDLSENLEKSKKNLLNVIMEVQTQLDLPEDTLSKILSGELEIKIFRERINDLIGTELKAEKEMFASETEQSEELRKACGDLQAKLSEAEKTISDRFEEIRVLQLDITRTREELAEAKAAVSEFESRLSSAETRKTETEERCRELEEVTECLKREIEEARTELQTRLAEEKSELESKSVRLKESYDALKAEIGEIENTVRQRDEEIRVLQLDITHTREELAEAKATTFEFESRLSSAETRKTETENRCRELEKVTEKLEREIEEARTELQTRLAFAEEKTELESESVRLRESYDALKAQMSEIENAVRQRDEEIRVLKSNESSVEELKKSCVSLESELTAVKTTISVREEEIQILRSDVVHAREEYSTAKSTVKDLESRLTSAEAQKTEAENRNRELEKTVENLHVEITLKENLRSEFETENSHLKQLLDALKMQMTETETVISTRDEEIRELKEYEFQLTSAKESLATADEIILKLKSQLQSVEVEKSEAENRCSELEERNEDLRVEIKSARNLENNPIYVEIQTQNGDLKERILKSEKMMSELKTELELAKEGQMNNILKVEELIEEIEELKRENKGFSSALTTIEETRKNLTDVLSQPGNDSDLPSERITKLMGRTLPDPRETKIVSEFVETITKTCKGVQNEMIKKFDSEKLEWENQRIVDIQNLQEQIKQLSERNTEREDALKQTKHELGEADEKITKLKSQLSSAEVEKVEMELRCRKLEENHLTLQAEIDTKETIIKGLDELKIMRQTVEIENGNLKTQIAELEDAMVLLKKNLEGAKEEEIARELRMKDLQNEIDQLMKEKEGLTDLSERLESLEKNNKNLMDFLAEVQTHLDMPEDTLSKFLLGELEVNKIVNERINHLVKAQMEGLKAENRQLKLGNDNLKEKIKQLTRLIGETAGGEAGEEPPNVSHSSSLSLRNKAGRRTNLCVRRLDKLEEINHNLTELIERMLTMTEFPDPDKLKLYSVRDFPNVVKKVVAHVNDLVGKMKELKEENAQLDEECETYAKIIKDLKKEAAAVWKTNKEKTEAMEAEMERLKEEKNRTEKEKQELEGKISKLDAECQKLKCNKSEEVPHICACGNGSKKINELKRTILVKEQKLLELQDLEAQTSSYKSQIEYLKNALEREKKKTAEEKDRNKKLQNELKEAAKMQKGEERKTEESRVLEELRMRGSLSGGIVQEFGDKEKMKKLAKDIGILKELCRARYAEIKRLEAVNAALRNATPKNSNQMDSPIRSRGYNTRSKNQVKELRKAEIIGKENSAF